jgi:hypothetical protein
VTIKRCSRGCIAANLLDVEACLDLWHCGICFLHTRSPSFILRVHCPSFTTSRPLLATISHCFQQALSNHWVHHSVFAWIESFPTKSTAFDSVLMIAVAHEATSFAHLSPPGGGSFCNNQTMLMWLYFCRICRVGKFLWAKSQEAQ